MPNPLVSVVVATYRSSHAHLKTALGSALAQSWRELEILVSDDSPDDSLRDVVEAFGDARLRYRHNAPALGVAHNHWSLFREAKGEFVAVLNHDDWLAPDFVQCLADALLAQPRAVLAFCDHWVIDTHGCRLEAQSDANSTRWGRARLAEGMHLPFADLIGNQTIPVAMGTLFRRSALPEVMPADAGPAYDLWLAYLLCRSGGGAWYVGKRLSAWRTHDANLTSAAGLDWLQGASACWNAVAQDSQFAAVRRLARRNAALAYYACATRCWARGRRRDCIRNASLSLRAMVTAKGLGACLLPLLPAQLAPLQWTGGRVRA